MSIRRPSGTTYGQKVLFDRLLSSELGNCKYKIEAVFEWKRRDQIMSLSFLNEEKARLAINLNIEKRSPLFSGENGAELEVVYRAYFIANFVHCLEFACDSDGGSYFSGLVTLEAINDMCRNGNAEGFSPISLQKKRTVRAIDIHCASRSLTRMLVEQGGGLSKETRRKWETYIDEFLSYSQLPEAEYRGSTHPVFTAVCEMKRTLRTLSQNPDAQGKYALFGKSGVELRGDMTFDDFLASCEKTKNQFWQGFSMRLGALFSEKVAGCGLFASEDIKKCSAKFRQNSVGYFKKHGQPKCGIIKDNFKAIKKLEKRINSAFIDNEEFASSGAIHCIKQ